MNHEDTEKYKRSEESNEILLFTTNSSEIEVICSILGFLLSMIAMHTDHLPVISDSGGFSYLGRNRRAPSLIFAVMNRTLAAAFIIKGSLAARKTIQLLMAALILILTTSHSHAGLGWTLEQFKQQYGNPVLNQEQIAGRIGYVFRGEDYIIAAFFHNTQVSRILYICRCGSVLDWERARALLRANAPDANWDDASKNEADNSYRVDGIKDGLESYHASLAEDGKMLAIWTQEDDEALRTKPSLDTPSVHSVVGSNDKRTAEVSAGDVPSESTPEINYPDVPANATPSSPTKRPASTHASRTKIASAKLRSPVSRREIFHAANFDAKAQSTPASPPHAGSYHPAPTPLLMNAGTGLYNSDYTQPFKNQKKTPGQ